MILHHTAQKSCRAINSYLEQFILMFSARYQVYQKKRVCWIDTLIEWRQLNARLYKTCSMFAVFVSMHKNQRGIFQTRLPRASPAYPRSAFASTWPCFCVNGQWYTSPELNGNHSRGTNGSSRFSPPSIDSSSLLSSPTPLNLEQFLLLANIMLEVLAKEWRKYSLSHLKWAAQTPRQA